MSNIAFQFKRGDLIELSPPMPIWPEDPDGYPTHLVKKIIAIYVSVDYKIPTTYHRLFSDGKYIVVRKDKLLEQSRLLNSGND